MFEGSQVFTAWPSDKSGVEVGMSMEYSWMVLAGESRRTRGEKNLLLRKFTHNKFHMDWHGTGPGHLG